MQDASTEVVEMQTGDLLLTHPLVNHLGTGQASPEDRNAVIEQRAQYMLDCGFSPEFIRQQGQRRETLYPPTTVYGVLTALIGIGINDPVGVAERYDSTISLGGRHIYNTKYGLDSMGTGLNGTVVIMRHPRILGVAAKTRDKRFTNLTRWIPEGAESVIEEQPSLLGLDERLVNSRMENLAKYVRNPGLLAKKIPRVLTQREETINRRLRILRFIVASFPGIRGIQQLLEEDPRLVTNGVDRLRFTARAMVTVAQRGGRVDATMVKRIARANPGDVVKRVINTDFSSYPEVDWVSGLKPRSEKLEPIISPMHPKLIESYEHLRLKVAT